MGYKPLIKVDCCGTGNSKVELPQETMTGLNNVHIQNYDWRLFLDKVLAEYDYVGPFVEDLNSEVRVLLKTRKTVGVWGSAQYLGGEIVMYRHSVWVFLHELAHMLTFDHGMKRADVYPYHGKRFGETLRAIAETWIGAEVEYRIPGRDIRTLDEEEPSNATRLTPSQRKALRACFEFGHAKRIRIVRMDGREMVVGITVAGRDPSEETKIRVGPTGKARRVLE
jgi:hypothetical protein